MSEPAKDDAPVKIGDVLAGKYRVEEVLGIGGMGAVVAARHLDLDELRALKFMLPKVSADQAATKRPTPPTRPRLADPRDARSPAGKPSATASAGATSSKPRASASAAPAPGDAPYDPSRARSKGPYD